jgi:hypothetical protein
MDYYAIKRVSNSALSRFKSEVVLGKPFHFPPKAAQFGEELHKLLFEPHLLTAPLPGLNYTLLQRLADKVQADAFCQSIFGNSHKEQVILFEDDETKAPCKCKVDAIQYGETGKATTIIDLKTTSQRDYRRFCESVLTYDYDRQAAFYLDATGADTFVFIGIQKVKPFDLFHYEITRDQGAVAYGRKKYKALLRKYVEYYNLAGQWERCI